MYISVHACSPGWGGQGRGISMEGPAGGAVGLVGL